MSSEDFRALQAPLKESYRATPESAMLTMRADGRLSPDVGCEVHTRQALVEAGLHPSTGGSRSKTCPGEMLLESLVACAGVTMNAVATALGLELKGASVHAEGDLDIRGTLGVAKDVPVGFLRIRLKVELETNVPDDQVRTLLRLTQRYCVVCQSLSPPPLFEVVRKTPPRLTSSTFLNRLNSNRVSSVRVFRE
jgi:uncharacterized OsmC-like protein